MRKIFFIAALAVIVLFTACDTESECEKNKTCQIEFSNGSDVTYSITVNNVFVTNLEAKKKITKTFPAGFLKVEVTPALWDPAKLSKVYENTLKACESKYLVFP